MNWNDPEARARLLEQVGAHEFARQWNRYILINMPMPWCEHCQCYHHHTARCIVRAQP